MINTLAQYIYVSLIGVFVLSGALFLLLQGTAPFGLRGAWVEEGVGHRLAVTVPVSDVVVGERVAFWGERAGGVQLATIAESARVDGMQFYRPEGGEWGLTYAARQLEGTVLFTLPLLGFVAHALTHVLGILFLLGAPLIMLVVDMLQAVYLGIQGRRLREEVRMYHDHDEASVGVPEEQESGWRVFTSKTKFL